MEFLDEPLYWDGCFVEKLFVTPYEHVIGIDRLFWECFYGFFYDIEWMIKLSFFDFGRNVKIKEIWILFEYVKEVIFDKMITPCFIAVFYHLYTSIVYIVVENGVIEWLKCWE